MQRLLELTRRVGNDPLLTQGSTGNSSAKVDGVLWIKASGKWMADALRDDILIPLDLKEVRRCLREGIDPAARFAKASLETALHAMLPHRIVLHVHCVNTIAWAVRSDAPSALDRALDSLPWRWVPYAASGLPLAMEIEQASSTGSRADVFVLGNHGLILAADDVDGIEALMSEVAERIRISPRESHPADYSALFDISQGSPWELPEDDALHALGTDPVAQSILRGGLLYPCQAIFSESASAEMFRPIPFPDSNDELGDYEGRRFLLIEGRGILVSRSITAPELEMLSGLAKVVQRLQPSAPVRYLTDSEVAGLGGQVACRYRAMSCQSHWEQKAG